MVDAGHEVRLFGRPPRHEEERGDALELLTPHFYGILSSRFAQGLPRRVFLILKGLSHLRGMYRLRKCLTEYKPDVIHFQWSPLPVIDRRFIPSFKRIAPTILTVHDSSPFNGAPGSYAQLTGAISIMTCFDHVVVHTEAAESRLVGYGLRGDSITRIPHGMLDRYPVRASGAGVNSQVQILMFGYLKQYKGIDVLLTAAAAMDHRALSQTHIRIIGKPMMDLQPLQRMIRKLQLDQWVTLEPRFVADEEVGSLFADADIVVLPYREIDASGVLMTALIAGTPIVASRLGLVAELLEDGTHGRLLAPGDHLALARALEQLVLSSSLRDAMSANVKALGASIPDWASIAGTTTSLYDNLGVQFRAAAHKNREPGQGGR